MLNKVSEKSRLVAFIFVWFLGPVGGHRYYVGRNGSATAMLLISFTVVGLAITFVWAFVDMVKIAAGSFEDNDGLILKDWSK